MTEPFTITPENRDHYIAEALPFCDNVAALFVRQAHLYGWRADLESIARLKMMEIIDRLMKTGETVFNKTHFFAKLRISVRRRLIDASEEFRIVRTPRRRGKPSTKKEPAVVATHGAILVDNRLALDFSCDGTLKNPPATKEVLIERCRDGLDLSILVQALDGRNRKEIAHDLRIPQREVRNRCGRLLKAGPARSPLPPIAAANGRPLGVVCGRPNERRPGPDGKALQVDRGLGEANPGPRNLRTRNPVPGRPEAVFPGLRGHSGERSPIGIRRHAGAGVPVYHGLRGQN